MPKRVIALVFLGIIALVSTVAIDESLSDAQSGNLTSNQTDVLGGLFASGADIVAVALIAVAAFAVLAGLRTLASA